MGIAILVDSDGAEIEATEKSTIGLVCAFTDEDGDAVVPDWIKWTLTDLSENIINSREQESVVTPAASVTIALSGVDLAIQASETSRESVKRRFIVEAQYDSDLGSNLPLNESCEFTIRNLKYIS